MNEETFEVEAMEGTEWSTWYKRIIGRYTVPTAQEERELLIRAHQGDMGARNELVVRNLRLVFKFAVRHFSRSRLTVSFADIIQAGNLGLIDAVDDFDPTRFATRFSTYAEHHIKKHFFRLMQQDQTVRIPTDTHSRVRKYLAAKEALCATLGREPTVGEVASRLAMDIKKVQLLETFSWQSSSLSDGEEVDMQLQSHELSPLDALLKKRQKKR